MKLAGATATLAVLPITPALAQTARLPVVRVLVPKSAAGEAWFNGLQTGAKLNVRWEAISVSALPSRMETAARAWQGGLWVALIQPNAAAGLLAAAQRAQASLWLSTVGAQPEITTPQTVSGQAWQTAYAAGAWTAQRLGRRVVQVASLHDAGYHLLPAFEAGVIAAGGTVVETIITHNPAQPGHTAEAALSRLAGHQAEAVHLSAYGQAGQDLAAQMAQQGVPVIASAWGSVPSNAWAYGVNNPFWALGQRTVHALASQLGQSVRLNISVQPGVWHTASRAPAETLALPANPLAETLFPAPRSGWLTEYGHLA